MPESSSPPSQPREIVQALNRCIETCKDGETGYAIAAAGVEAPALEELLLAWGKQRAHFVAALEDAVRGLGERERTTRGVTHRGFMSSRPPGMTADDRVLLEACTRGETAALKVYEETLASEHLSTLPPPIQELVAEQYGAIRETKSEILRRLSEL